MVTCSDDILLRSYNIPMFYTISSYCSDAVHLGCVLAPLLFNIFFAAVINVASTRFKANKDIMDALLHLRKKRGAGGRGEATAGETVLATPLWGMLYVDDAGGDRGRVRGVWPHRVGGQDWDHVFTHKGDGGVHRHIVETAGQVF